MCRSGWTSILPRHISACATPLDGIGAARVRVAGISSRGLHLEFIELSLAARAELERKLASIREENREIIARAVDVANEISRLFEGLIQQGKLTQESLFDNDYVAVEGSDPVQHVTKFLPASEDVLPPLQEALLTSDAPILSFREALGRFSIRPRPLSAPATRLIIRGGSSASLPGRPAPSRVRRRWRGGRRCHKAA
jgi:hypothetical protein